MWEVWRRVEGRISNRDPSVRVCIDLDKFTVDLRPPDLEIIAKLKKTLEVMLQNEVIQNVPILVQ